MAEEFDDNKTEEPTPRRRETSREEGQVVFSPDLTAGLLLLSITLAFWLFGGYWLRQFGITVADQIRAVDRTDWGVPQTMLSVRWLTVNLVLTAGAVVAGAWVLNAAVSAFQAGLGFHTKPLMFNPEKLSIVKGWERIFSLDGAMNGFMAPLKLTLTLITAAVFVWVSRGGASRAGQGSLEQSMWFTADVATRLMLALALVTLTMGVMDYMFKRFRHEQKLKMTREEVKREHKEDQGDAQIKQRIRRFQQESRKKRSLREVPTATAVITNPTHFAVAVRYDAATSAAPVVVAKGADSFARQIIAVAQKHGVPVLERKPVARALFALTEVGDEIPMEMYRAVAEILAEVYRRKRAA
ncbi:MAG: EscU/YscU/HrcU family type III secretion system export apparatus switch protein [Planctomycetaceae bacterium]